MTLYHGTNTDIHAIDLAKSNPYKDFGRGFYLNSIYSQAREMADKRAKFYGGTPIVKTYDFDESRDGVAYLLDRFNDGLIDLDELAQELEYKELLFWHAQSHTTT